MADRVRRVSEVVVPDHRLGRHVNHDPRSLAYKVAETSVPETVRWNRHVAAFNQGDLGSCTIQSLLGLLCTDPFWGTLSKDMQAKLADPSIQTNMAQPLYREVTRLDPFRGAWEPDDTGSDGLSAAKVGQQHGWDNGYQHITSVAAAHAAIKAGPFMSGLPWYSGMDSPDGQGIVRPSGYVRGGHEWVFAGYDVASGLWECWNSWSSSFAKGGRFWIGDDDYANLLNQQGDATTLVPITAPAPTPNPSAVDVALTVALRRVLPSGWLPLYVRTPARAWLAQSTPATVSALATALRRVLLRWVPNDLRSAATAWLVGK